MNLQKDMYEVALKSTRDLLQTNQSLRMLASPDITPKVMHRFLIEYSALAIQITEPVEGWIRRAGERTLETGLKEAGTKLLKHAKHEADHHLMLIEDTKALVQRWNQLYPSATIDLTTLMTQKPTRTMQRYIDLHEDTIKSEVPFGQVAIELEIEGISVAYAPKLIANARVVLGDNVAHGLSFLDEHAALDVGHTEFNNRLMNAVLEARPDSVQSLIDIGSNALLIYIAFFEECLERAQKAVAATQLMEQQQAPTASM